MNVTAAPIRSPRERALQFRHLLDRFVVDGDVQIARPHACDCCGRALDDLGHLGAACATKLTGQPWRVIAFLLRVLA